MRVIINLSANKTNKHDCTTKQISPAPDKNRNTFLRSRILVLGRSALDIGLWTLSLAAGEGFEPPVLRSERSVLPGYTIPQRISDLRFQIEDYPIGSAQS